MTEPVTIVTDHGTEDGDVCGRLGCDGVIRWSKSENCSCHLNAPCGSCSLVHLECPECGWEAGDDEATVPQLGPLTGTNCNACGTSLVWGADGGTCPNCGAFVPHEALPDTFTALGREQKRQP